MSIEKINDELCTGCGICLESCPMDVIGMDDETAKAVIAYPGDCMMCQWCALDCPEDAIYISPIKSSPLLTSWG